MLKSLLVMPLTPLGVDVPALGLAFGIKWCRSTPSFRNCSSPENLTLNLSWLSINTGRGPVRAERVFSPVLHAAHIVKYITSQSVLACYKRTESCFARQDVESGSRTLAKNTFPVMPSLKLQYLHVHFPPGNYCSARNIHHSMVHMGASLCGPKLIGTGHRGK